ncbi:putative R3H domain protein [Aspergillus saccharolyticus JOP 1030-1]|uniref:R3H domain protein n=1 Tax=Aspergillus saccharolyticus JOP 1030-1 TaxID=1450539 RepID=A0A318ZDE7_9EURO|nr:R3H domain protein [Aspergillus saccharolyticus JOP 1030-1]PYH41540.1 R3H domain protein [Aspergillus saccharolyticus JOP 1030-1]
MIMASGSMRDEHRLSFAKIAAMPPPFGSGASMPPDELHDSQSTEVPSSSGLYDSHDIHSGQSSPSNTHNDSVANDRTVDGLSQAVQGIDLSEKKYHDDPDFPSEGPGNGSLKRETSFDEDDRTHLSSSSTKPTSFDSKSMASVTTFAMDEKDSLRPDDSASVQAIDEEESLSGPASNAPNSLTGSDSGARGFRDIQGPRAILQPTGQLYPDGTQHSNGALLPDAISSGFLASNSEGFQAGRPIHGFPSEPDEKLLEAMKSPKDRLLILQLEEKVRHFIENSKEHSLELPPSNAFGRLLAHKLGDYYHLTHFVDNNVTSVRLHRTPFCRLPTPLAMIYAANNSTPPPAMPAMKIMRRAGSERPSTEGSIAASSGYSKDGSEAGDSGNDGDRGGSSTGATPAKDRLALTREEREAKYQEARERIFRDFPESKAAAETVNGDSSANMSRSSSTSGRKKTHRQKTPHDDSFEARSQFNAYYPGMHFGNGSGPFNMAMNDPSFSNQPCMVGPGVSPPNMGYSGAQTGAMFPGPVNQNTMSHYSMPVSPQMTPSGPWPNGPVPQQSPFAGYASITQSPAMASTKSSPALGSYPMPNPVQYQQTPGWSTPPYPGGYHHQPHRTHAPAPTPAAWTNYQTQPPNPTSYPYTQYPGQPMSPAMQPHSGSHPMPGSFSRSPFNPQTRSFVPGGAATLARHPNKANQHGMGPYPGMQPGVLPQWNGYQDVNSKGQDTLGSAGQNLPRGIPSSGRDSIAKWGTPSHLPPKPPPSEVRSEYDIKHRSGPASTPPFPGSALNSKNGPLVVSGGTILPRTN